MHRPTAAKDRSARRHGASGAETARQKERARPGPGRGTPCVGCWRAQERTQEKCAVGSTHQHVDHGDVPQFVDVPIIARPFRGRGEARGLRPAPFSTPRGHGSMGGPVGPGPRAGRHARASGAMRRDATRCGHVSLKQKLANPHSTFRTKSASRATACPRTFGAATLGVMYQFNETQLGHIHETEIVVSVYDP